MIDGSREDEGQPGDKREKMIKGEGGEEGGDVKGEIRNESEREETPG